MGKMRCSFSSMEQVLWECRLYSSSGSLYHTELLRNNVFWTAINLTEEWPNALTGIVCLPFSLWGGKNIAKGCVQRNIS